MATRPSGSAPPIWHDPTFRSRPERSQKREGLRVADKPTSSSILAPPVLRERPETQWPLERFKPRRENPRGHDVFGLHAREIPNDVPCTARYRDHSVEIQALVAVMSRRPEPRWASFSSSSPENMKYHTNVPHLLPAIAGRYRLPCMIMHDYGIVANFRTLKYFALYRHADHAPVLSQVQPRPRHQHRPVVATKNSGSPDHRHRWTAGRRLEWTRSARRCPAGAGESTSAQGAPDLTTATSSDRKTRLSNVRLTAPPRIARSRRPSRS